MYKSLMSIALFGLLISVGAQEILTAASHRDWVGRGQITSTNGVITIAGPGDQFSRRYLSIDLKKTYRLQGEFKALPGASKQAFFRFGLNLRHGKWQLRPQMINCHPGTETELVAACRSQDTVLQVKNAAKWRANPAHCVAFDVDTTSQRRDLPNGQMSRLGIKQVVQKNGHWEIVLARPCGRNFPAGTAIREHFSGWSGFLVGTAKKVPTAEWQKIDVVIPPGVAPSANLKKWWLGTESAGFLVMTKHGGVMMRNLKLMAIPNK